MSTVDAGGTTDGPITPNQRLHRRVNLYFGLKSKGWRHLYWFHIAELARQVVRPPGMLHVVHYFTARISRPEAKRRRQNTFLEANLEIGGISVHLGTYRDDPRVCRKCGQALRFQTEKKTDVNIAVQLLTDGFYDQFEDAILVSADADLVPVVQAIRGLFPSKRVVVGFPPDRFSKELAGAANAWFHLSRSVLAKSQLPNQIQKDSRVVLERPKEWR
jgi:uncharacterized LabA/DUF88 family protein